MLRLLPGFRAASVLATCPLVPPAGWLESTLGYWQGLSQALIANRVDIRFGLDPFESGTSTLAFIELEPRRLWESFELRTTAVVTTVEGFLVRS